MSRDDTRSEPYGGRFTKEAPRDDQAGALRRKQVRRAMIAGTVGTSIEWYDFFLYGTAAALVFPHLFFPGASAYAGALASFATYAVGFAARPVGAAIFGHFGDRIGRKATLISTLMLMGIASTLIGVLPGYDTLGFWAPTLLVLLRLIQGIGVGGEWGGSVTLCMEWGNPKRRGFIGSWPQVGVPIGLLLSTGAVSLLTHTMGDSFETWGWRLPFLFSIVLVGVGLWVRLGVLESPLFAREVENDSLEDTPLLETVKREPREIILSALLRMSEQAPFYIFTAFVLAYGTEELGFSKGFLTNAVMVAAALSLFSVPFFGHLSDKIGRKRMYMTGAAATMVIGVPYFLMLDSKVGVLVVLAIVDLADPARHAVRPAGRAHRRELPDAPALQRGRARLPAGLGVRGRPGAAAGHLAAAPLQQLAADRHLHRGVRRRDPDRDGAAPRAQPRAVAREFEQGAAEPVPEPAPASTRDRVAVPAR